MELALAKLPGGREKPKRKHVATKPQLLTRDALDGRTNAAKVFDRLVGDIEGDLGGRDQLSTIERALVEGFAGAALTLYHLNTKLALGQEIDLAQHAQAVSAMVRVASRLGISRRARGNPFVIIGAAILLLFPVVTLAIRWLNYKNTIYRVYPDRLQIDEGFFTRRCKEVYISSVREVNLRRGILQRLVGLGSVYVATTATGQGPGWQTSAGLHPV